MFKEIEIIAQHNSVFLDNDLNEYQEINWNQSQFIFYECLQQLKINTNEILINKNFSGNPIFLEKLDNFSEKFEDNPRFKISFSDYVNANQWILFHYLCLFFQCKYSILDFELNRQEKNEIIFPVLSIENKSNCNFKNIYFERLLKEVNTKKTELLWERFLVLMKNSNFENKLVLVMSFVQTHFQIKIHKTKWINQYLNNEDRYKNILNSLHYGN